jgi:hypothetical protein
MKWRHYEVEQEATHQWRNLSYCRKEEVDDTL